MSASLKRTFDAAKRITSEESAHYQRTYQYDAKGRTTQESFQNGKDAGTYSFTYTGEGRLKTSEISLDNDRRTEIPNLYGRCGDCGLFPGKTTYEYTREGFVKEEQMIQPGDVLIRVSRYGYDAHGRRTQEWVYEKDGSKAAGAAVRLEVSGREVSFTWTNGLAEATYSYDAHGNWTKAVVTRQALGAKREVSEVLYRDIVYR